MAQTFEDLSKQRLDFSTGPNGETIATLSVTLPNGQVYRFSETTDAAEIDNLGAALASAEVTQSKIEGVGMSEAEIAGLFSSIGKAFKKVTNVARKVATSKVFKAAGRGLMLAAPALGPLGPAALAIGGGMEVASRLSKASYAAEAGARRASRLLGRGAGSIARKVAPRGWRTLMSYGNRKRRAALGRAAATGRARRRVTRYRRIIRRRPRRTYRRSPWTRRFLAPRFAAPRPRGW